MSEEPIKERPSKAAKAAKAAREQAFAVHSYASYWPIALAVAMLIVFIGIIIHPIVLGVGVVLTAAAMIGWGLERR